MYDVIVVGTDGSERAAHAVAWAVQLARTCDATLHVILAYQGTRESIVREARAIVEGVVADLDADGLELRSHAVLGDPVDALLDFAYDANADLVVVGNRGMTGNRRFLGSVPNSIAHDSRCAVLIVPTDRL